MFILAAIYILGAIAVAAWLRKEKTDAFICAIYCLYWPILLPICCIVAAFIVASRNLR